jgi:hypothetical protein
MALPSGGVMVGERPQDEEALLEGGVEWWGVQMPE